MRRKKRRKSKDKAQCQYWHAYNRFRMRYGIELSKALMREIVADIQEGRAHHAYAQSTRVSVWDVLLNGQYIRVVYDSNRQTIVTCFPPYKGYHHISHNLQQHQEAYKFFGSKDGVPQYGAA